MRDRPDLMRDAVEELLRLDMTPAVIAGGSGGARVSLLTAARYREVASGLVTWWIGVGMHGLMTLGVHYCRNVRSAARQHFTSWPDLPPLRAWAEEVLG